MVNRDSIRLALHGRAFWPQREDEVTEIETAMIKSLFIAGHNNVIVDATHISEKRRAEKARLVPEGGEVFYKLFLADKSVCVDRAKKNGQEMLVPVIELMAKRITYPVKDLYK